LVPDEFEVKISIITPSLNQAAFLEETLRSVLGQCYPSLESIVIDGGSTDGSVDIINRYQHELAYWLSEPDRGQSDAINKGLRRATGDVVTFLNSDDLYLPGAFAAVAEHFQKNPASKWVCGDTICFGRGHQTRFIPAVVPRSAAHCLSWAYKAPQPGMFWKRELLASEFDPGWRYCFDHELYVRLLLAGHKCDHLPVPLAAYRLHGASKTVAESDGFDREFDAIADIYEQQLSGGDRRWCAGTRLLRRSYSASRSGKAGQAVGCLLKSLLVHPGGMGRRPFWGCLRQALRVGLRLWVPSHAE
jgi:glycosyltransferase involved in cell wall biosynthesis